MQDLPLDAGSKDKLRRAALHCIAQRGYAVCNGGYDGTMAAVSRGAKDGGGRTIGVTVEALSWRSPNRWIDEEVSTASLLDIVASTQAKHHEKHHPRLQCRPNT